MSDRKLKVTTRMYIEGKPRDFDVICGIGVQRLTSHHPGNLRYEKLIHDFRRQYRKPIQGGTERMSKRQKTQLINTVIDILTREGSRFVHYDKFQKLWFLVPMKAIHEKVSFGLRDSVPVDPSADARAHSEGSSMEDRSDDANEGSGGNSSSFMREPTIVECTMEDGTRTKRPPERSRAGDQEIPPSHEPSACTDEDSQSKRKRSRHVKDEQRRDDETRRVSDGLTGDERQALELLSRVSAFHEERRQTDSRNNAKRNPGRNLARSYTGSATPEGGVGSVVSPSGALAGAAATDLGSIMMQTLPRGALYCRRTGEIFETTIQTKPALTENKSSVPPRSVSGLYSSFSTLSSSSQTPSSDDANDRDMLLSSSKMDTFDPNGQVHNANHERSVKNYVGRIPIPAEPRRMTDPREVGFTPDQSCLTGLSSVLLRGAAVLARDEDPRQQGKIELKHQLNGRHLQQLPCPFRSSCKLSSAPVDSAMLLGERVPDRKEEGDMATVRGARVPYGGSNHASLLLSSLLPPLLRDSSLPTLPRDTPIEYLKSDKEIHDREEQVQKVSAEKTMNLEQRQFYQDDWSALEEIPMYHSFGNHVDIPTRAGTSVQSHSTAHNNNPSTEQGHNPCDQKKICVFQTNQQEKTHLEKVSAHLTDPHGSTREANQRSPAEKRSSCVMTASTALSSSKAVVPSRVESANPPNASSPPLFTSVSSYDPSPSCPFVVQGNLGLPPQQLHPTPLGTHAIMQQQQYSPVVVVVVPQSLYPASLSFSLQKEFGGI